MDQNGLLKRLLCASWFIKKPGVIQGPNSTDIFGRLEDAPGFERSGITLDNIRSYFDKGKVSVPRNAKLLGYINDLLFGSDTRRYVSDLDATWQSVAIDDSVRKAVNGFFNGRDNNYEVNHVLVAPDYTHLDPASIDTSADRGALDPHLLYHSPAASSLWDTVKESRQYQPIYRACEDGLNELLGWKDWGAYAKGVEAAFNLGVGSSSKDKLVLESLNNWCESAPTFAWVDASLYMLTSTIRKISTTDIGRALPAALQVDFENPTRLKTVYEDAFPYHSKFASKKVFFILGFTLSNLDEEKFFKVYSRICTKGDLFVFPMHFIPPEATDPAVLETFMAKLKESYVFDEGKQLSQAGLAILRHYAFDREGHAETLMQQFDGNNRSVQVEFTVFLKPKSSKKGNTAESQEVRTAKSSRHFRTDYEVFLRKNGFTIAHETSERNGVTTLLVEFIGWS